MPTDIFEDGLDLRIGLLEAAPISANAAYPFPRLKPTGNTEQRRFRSVVMENAYLRVTLVPALGGRILSIFDKRTGRKILPAADPLTFASEGRRGVTIPVGIQLRIDGEDRLNALGNVALQIEDAADEESLAGVWIAETAMPPGIGFHQRIALAPDRAELLIDVRIANRTFAPLPYDGELALPFGDGEWDGVTLYSPSRDAGLCLTSETPFDGVRMEGGVLRYARFGKLRWLAARQMDTWTVRVTPFSGLGGVSASTNEAAVFMNERILRVQSASERRNHKLVLLTESGETLEAPAELYGEHLLEIPLEGLPSAPRAVVLMDEGKQEILRFDRSAPSPPPRGFERSPEEEARPSGPTLTTPVEALRRETFGMANRYLAHTLLGRAALAERDWLRADRELEQAIGYNAEDPLLWWAKAVTRRMAGSEEESSELLNAHYLAPLEPALRAEGFLSQPLAIGKDPSPLLEVLAENPEEFVEVACLLIEQGLLDQANRWIDEALRHRDLAMLRLLMAYCLLRGTRMDADAAEHVAAAARVAGGPYPWRAVEREAIQFLVTRFPADAHLAELASWIAS